MSIDRFLEQVRALVAGNFYSPLLIGPALFLVCRSGGVYTPIEALYGFKKGVWFASPNSHLYLGDSIGLDFGTADTIQAAGFRESNTLTPTEARVRQELCQAVGVVPFELLSSNTQ